MLSSQEEQQERIRVMRNDARLREQAGTFMSHTHSDVGGRYGAAQPSPYVIGSTPTPIYPQAAFQHDPCGLEPPLGYRVDAPDEPSTTPPVEGLPNSAPAVAPSHPVNVEQRGAGLGLPPYRRY
jgi:hypothetical protein